MNQSSQSIEIHAVDATWHLGDTLELLSRPEMILWHKISSHMFETPEIKTRRNHFSICTPNTEPPNHIIPSPQYYTRCAIQIYDFDPTALYFASTQKRELNRVGGLPVSNFLLITAAHAMVEYSKSKQKSNENKNMSSPWRCSIAFSSLSLSLSCR